MLIVKGRKTAKVGAEEVLKSLEGFEKVVVDLGTGDGRFVYKNALGNPKNFYIGIDPSEKQLRIFARDVQRKRLKNASLVVGSIEKLPSELIGIADEIWVIFPWGSLLEAFAKPVRSSLENLEKLLKKNGVVQVIFGYDELLEPSETKRLNLPMIDLGYIKKVLIPEYEKLGFKVIECGEFDRMTQKVETSWYKRLNQSNRTWYFLEISRSK